MAKRTARDVLRSRPVVFWVAIAVATALLVIGLVVGAYLIALLAFTAVFVGLSQVFYPGKRPPREVTVVPPPAHVSIAEEIAKLADLRDQGLITDAEYEATKAKLLRT